MTAPYDESDDEEGLTGIEAAWEVMKPSADQFNPGRDRAGVDERAKIYKRKQLWLYGPAVERMWIEQEWRCANPGCDNGIREKYHIDHDHQCCPGGQKKTCGKCVRGILCPGCNRALGYSGQDPARLRGLADYLEARPLKSKANDQGPALPREG